MSTTALSVFITLMVVTWVGRATVSAALPATAPPTPVPFPAGHIVEAWQKGPHSHTYDEGKGPNTYCARCHSPLNWDPASKVDPQPNCVSCKFPFDRAMRVAQGNPPVAQKDWKSITCEVCHQVRDGKIDPMIAWWNQEAQAYESVSDATALCTRCHTDTEILRHRPDLGTRSHVGFGCTSCHEPHSTAAGCSTPGCHSESEKQMCPRTGQDTAHRQVTCGACHDAGGLPVGPDADSGLWVTFRTTEVMGRSSTKAYQSHNLTPNVDCTRCHHAGNPWNLAVHADEPEQPAAPAAVPARTTPPDVQSATPAALSVAIATPAEGETLYGGPGVFTYIAQLTGSVRAEGLAPSRVGLMLEVISDGTVVAEHPAAPLADGSFSFDLTVNPDSSVEPFPLERQSCETCHRLGEVALPSGPITLRVTASASGQKAVAERHIVVDRAGYATVPVRVTLEGDRAQPVAGVPVTGSAWLYLWRMRTCAATTNSEGWAQVRVEALAAAPTHYRFRVEPTVIDRVLYESIHTVQVDLEPGATSAPPIALTLRGRLGAINGTLAAPGGGAPPPLPVYAILLPEGRLFRTESSPAGEFSFFDLPVGEYILTIGADALAPMQLAVPNWRVAIPPSGTAAVNLPLAPTLGAVARGLVRDKSGQVLPFAWVVVEKDRVSRTANPITGEFALPLPAGGPRPAVITAPGYFSLVLLLGPGEATETYTLARRPETKSLRWGTGTVTVPPESQATIEPGIVSLGRGWVWGTADGEVITISTDYGRTQIVDGAFAVKALGPGDSWMYVSAGSAVHYPRGSVEPVRVRAGEMLALDSIPRPIPVPADPVAIAALHRANEAPLSPVWEQSFDARVRDALAGMGVTAAQVLTLLTYTLVVLLLVTIPPLGVVWWSRHRAPHSRRDSIGGES